MRQISHDVEQDKIIFILVVTKDNGLKGNDHLKTFPNDRKVLDFILTLTHDKDPRKVKSIKSMDVNGRIKEYEVIFDGRLSLEAMPDESKQEVKVIGGTGLYT